MISKDFLKVIIGAWGVPLVIIVVALYFTPDLNRPKDSFPSVVFTPREIKLEAKEDLKGARSYQLTILHPQFGPIVRNNPHKQPLAELFRRIPGNVPLQVIYSPSELDNMLLEISQPDSPAEPLLSFEETMAEFATRRRVVFTVAAVWFLLGTLFVYALWKDELGKYFKGGPKDP